MCMRHACTHHVCVFACTHTYICMYRMVGILQGRGCGTGRGPYNKDCGRGCQGSRTFIHPSRTDALMDTHTDACTDACMGAHTHTGWMHACMHRCTHGCLYTCLHACLNTAHAQMHRHIQEHSTARLQQCIARMARVMHGTHDAQDAHMQGTTRAVCAIHTALTKYVCHAQHTCATRTTRTRTCWQGGLSGVTEAKQDSLPTWTVMVYMAADNDLEVPSPSLALPS